MRTGSGLRVRMALGIVALVVALGSAVILPATTVSAQVRPQPARSLETFLTDLVIPDLDRFWTMVARESGFSYNSPKVRLFKAGDFVVSPCGNEPVRGHMYCPINATLFLDTSARSDVSFARLWQQDRDFAVVLIVAHEWGHHIQQQLGLMRGARSVRQVELQADCLAGLYARYGEKTGKMEPGDLEEGIAVSMESGDSGHGTGRERSEAFMTGYREFSGAACGLST